MDHSSSAALDVPGGQRDSQAPTLFASETNAPTNNDLPLPRPLTNFSTVGGGERISQAPTLFAAASASADDLKQPANAPTPHGDRSASSVSLPISSDQPSTNNLPYRNSLAPTAVGSAQQLGASEKGAATPTPPRAISPVPELGNPSDAPSKNKRKKLLLILGGVLVVAVIGVAVAVPVAILKHTKKGSSGSSSSSSGNSGSGENGGSNSAGPVTGGDGTTITTEKGTTFTYVNTFGGTWYDDPEDPWNYSAQAQSWTPPLSQEWDYQNDPMRGVNLGGWLVPEPFIVPSLYEPYLNVTNYAHDEWTLCENMAADTANGGLDQLENHYDTFITEEDFAQIAGAGLNWVRIPIGFWAVSKLPEEPFLEGVSWKYALKAFKWARKYGIRVQLDLHAVPGSQNGFDHSGKGGIDGQVNFMVGPMGLANAQRTLDTIRFITEFISQPEYKNVVTMFGIINEPQATKIGNDQMTSFHLEVHDMMRNITGTGVGNGPWIAFHDAFRGLSAYKDYLPGHDRVALDTHPYLMFGSPDRSPLASQVDKPCSNWGSSLNNSMEAFGFTFAGEFSLAVNDCGRWINGVNQGTRWEGTYGNGDGTKGDCTPWNDYASWTQDTKDSFKTLALNSFDALGHYFFWTWKIGASSVTGKIETPMWSYQLGLQEGWMPTDPRLSVGACGNTNPASPLTAEMLGESGTGQIQASVKSQYPWPPKTISPDLDPDNVRVYTATGPIPTLAMPTPTVGSADGWFDVQDTMPAYTPIAGCTYPDPWGSADASNPGPCDGTTDTTTDSGDDTTDDPTRRIRRVRNVVPQPRRTPAP